MSHFLPNNSWAAEEEIHHMERGELVAISYVSTDCSRFVRVTVKMTVVKHTRDATGKITSTDEFGPVNGYHVQPCQTVEEWGDNGLAWKVGKMVERLTPESSGLAYVWECIVQGAINDGLIKESTAWADRAIMGREEYNAAMEAEKAKEREEHSTTERSLDEILTELGMGMDAHGNAYDL